METAEQLKERIQAVPTGVRGQRNFDRALRVDIVKYSRQEMAAGASQNAIAQKLGMKAWTLNRWHQNERKRASGFVEVAVAHARAGAAASAQVTATDVFEVTCRSGYEVRVPASFEAEPLRRLLVVLEGA